MSTYFITRWQSPQTGKWITSSTSLDRPTKEQADAQLAADIAYFYSDIKIEVVQVTETVLETHFGSQSRLS